MAQQVRVLKQTVLPFKKIEDNGYETDDYGIPFYAELMFSETKRKLRALAKSLLPKKFMIDVESLTGVKFPLTPQPCAPHIQALIDKERERTLQYEDDEFSDASTVYNANDDADTIISDSSSEHSFNIANGNSDNDALKIESKEPSAFTNSNELKQQIESSNVRVYNQPNNKKKDAREERKLKRHINEYKLRCSVNTKFLSPKPLQESCRDVIDIDKHISIGNEKAHIAASNAVRLESVFGEKAKEFKPHMPTEQQQQPPTKIDATVKAKELQPQRNDKIQRTAKAKIFGTDFEHTKNSTDRDAKTKLNDRSKPEKLITNRKTNQLNGKSAAISVETQKMLSTHATKTAASPKNQPTKLLKAAPPQHLKITDFYSRQ